MKQSILYKTITKTEWDKTHKDYKTIIKGQEYKMYLDQKLGTILAPVKVNN